jgi:hypothetical protein
MTSKQGLKAEVTNDALRVTPGLPPAVVFAITPSVLKIPLT